MHTVHNRVLSSLDCDIAPRPEAGDVLSLYGGALSLAHSVYAKNHHPISRQQVLLTVITKNERNTMDQRMVEFESGLICLRRTLEEIGRRAKLDDGRLILEDKEVAVVYFRSAYAPRKSASAKCDVESWSGGSMRSVWSIRPCIKYA